MRYLLDSDILSDLYEQTSPDHQVVFRRFETLGEDDDLAVSILALYELEYGYANSFEGKKPSLRRRIENVRSRFIIYGLSDDSARTGSGRTKRSARDKLQPLGRASGFDRKDASSSGVISAITVRKGIPFVGEKVNGSMLPVGTVAAFTSRRRIGSS